MLTAEATLRRVVTKAAIHYQRDEIWHRIVRGPLPAAGEPPSGNGLTGQGEEAERGLGPPASATGSSAASSSATTTSSSTIRSHKTTSSTHRKDKLGTSSSLVLPASQVPPTASFMPAPERAAMEVGSPITQTTPSASPTGKSSNPLVGLAVGLSNLSTSGSALLGRPSATNASVSSPANQAEISSSIELGDFKEQDFEVFRSLTFRRPLQVGE